MMGVEDELFGPATKQPPSAADELFASDSKPEDKRVEFLTANTNESPEKASRIHDLHQKTGIPRAFISENFDEIDREAGSAEFSSRNFIRNNQKMKEWIAKNPDYIPLLREDQTTLESLSSFINGEGGDSWATVYEKGKETVSHKLNRAWLAGGQMTAAEMRNAPLETSANIGKGMLRGFGYLTAAMAQIGEAPANLLFGDGTSFKDKIRMIDENTPDVFFTPEAMGKIENDPLYREGLDRAKYHTERMKELRPDVKDWSVKDIVSAAGTSIFGDVLPTIVGATLGGVGGGTATFSSSVFLDSVSEQVAEGKSLGDAISYGTWKIISEGLPESLPLSVAVKGGKSIWKTIMKTGAVEGAEEVLTEVMDIAYERYKEDKEITLVEAMDRVLKAGVIGAISGGALGGVQNIPSAIENAKTERTLKQRKEMFEALGDLSKKSSLATRQPNVFSEAVEQMTKDGPIENIYVPVELFQKHFREQEINPDELAKEMGIERQYTEAVNTGDKIAIPTGVYAAHIAGTEHHNSFANDWSYRLPDGTMTMSANETKEYLKEAENTIEDDKAVADQAFNTAIDEVMAPIRQQVRQQFAGDIATKNEAIIEAHLRTLSRNMGLDPREVAKRSGLTIQEGAEGQRATLNQADEASLINPVPRDVTDSEKADALFKLSKQNDSIMKKVLREVDSKRPGVLSKTNFKTKESIIAKANRPEIKARKPWWGVEHVKDSYRFRSVVDNFADVGPAIVDVLAAIKRIVGKPAEILKMDVAKMRNPGPWGWRMVALDLRMPNGQIVEYYFPTTEMHAALEGRLAGQTKGNHELFEKWRNKDMLKATPEENEAFRKDAAESKKHYDNAMKMYFERTGQSAEGFDAILANLEALAESLTSTKSLEISSDVKRSSLTGAPALNADHLPSDNTMTRSSNRDSNTQGLLDISSPPSVQSIANGDKTANAAYNQTGRPQLYARVDYAENGRATDRGDQEETSGDHGRADRPDVRRTAVARWVRPGHQAFVELDPSRGAEFFLEALQAAKQGIKFGSSVFAYPVEDYRDMRLFVSENGLSGFALKPDGDLVSVFSSDKGAGMGRQILDLTIQHGAKKLDAFDTVLPGLYAEKGFVVAARLKWDEDQKPGDWNKELYKKFNNGEPDVVFMAYDAKKKHDYVKGEGPTVKTYDEAVALQNKAIEEAERGATLYQSDQSEDQTKTAAFKKWFGDSKVVDENGKPLVVYHGGLGADKITVFDPGYGGQTTGNNEHGAFHFTDDKQVAEDYGRQAFIRRYQDDPESLITDGLLPEGTEIDTATGAEYDRVADMAEENIGLQATYLRIENPIVIDMQGNRVDVVEIERISKFVKTGIDEDGDLFDKYHELMFGEYAPSDIEAFREEIELKARENNGLDETDEIEDWQFRDATQEVMEENGYERDTTPIDGIIIKNMIADIGDYSNKIADQFIVFEPNQIKSAIGNRGTFDPANPNILFQTGDINRGSITQTPTGDIIRLFQTKNLSTLLHELGHKFLFDLAKFSQMEEAPQQMKDDVTKALKWLKLDSLDDLNLDNKVPGSKEYERAVEAHEKWARGFEQYLKEGKAPSQSLRRVFATIKAWMVAIYDALKQGRLDVQLNPEIKGVFDRLLATQQEIEAARGDAKHVDLFTTAEDAGMTEQEFNAYRKTVEDAHRSAQEEIDAKIMREYKRTLTDEWKKAKETVREQVEKQVAQLPPYRAVDKLIEQGIMLNRAEVKALGPDIYRRVQRGTMADDGVPLSVAADGLGFASGEEMVRTIATAEKRGAMVSRLVDARMNEMFGNMLTDGSIVEEAKKALSNDARGEVIVAEIKALQKKAREVQPFIKAEKNKAKQEARAGAEMYRQVAPKLADVREHAKQVMATKPIREIKPNTYFNTARQASRAAIAAVRKGDYLMAAFHKGRELLNLEMYREALKAQDIVEEGNAKISKAFVSDIKQSKSKNMDMVNAARAMLAAHGIGKADANPMAYLDDIRQYDPETYENLRPIFEPSLKSQKHYSDMTVEEYIGLRDTVLALMHGARRSKQALIDGKLMDREQIVNELSDRVAEITKTGPSEKLRTTMDESQKLKVGLLSVKAALRRVEHWVDAMDGGNPNGVFRKYIWKPIADATNNYRDEKRKVIAKYLEMVQEVAKTIVPGEIPAKEIGFKFKSKSELLHAILHRGNNSNFQKLLVGYKWGELREDGTLDTTRWDAFEARMRKEGVLTKADYDFAQNVWNLMEEMKPKLQKAHHDMYGYYFDEVTANEFSNEFGTYRGGYVPAKVDPNVVHDAEIKQDRQDILHGQNSFAFPTTGRGATMKRIEGYAKPLQLDMRAIPVHIDWAMRFAYIEPTVKDIGRIMLDKQFVAAMQEADPTAINHMLTPWLQRAASQKTSTKGMNPWLDKFWTGVRGRSGMQVMVLNVINTLQQYTGITVALTKVKAGNMRGAFWDYLTNRQETLDTVNEKSAFMRNRVFTSHNEVMQTIDDLLLNPSKYEKVKDYATKHGYFLQQATQGFVDVVVWKAAYNEAIEAGVTDAEAVSRADSVVRETQGSFAPEDISRAEAHTPFTRAFMMFYNYFNMISNLMGTEFRNIATNELGLARGAGRALYVYTMALLIPAFIGDALLRALIAGKPDDDDDGYLDDVIKMFFESQFKALTAMIPGVGQLANVAYGKTTKKQYDDHITASPAISTIESAVNAPFSVYKALAEDGSHKKAVKDTLMLIGMTTGLPVAALGRPLGYLADVEQGKAQPESTLDVVRGLVSGQDVNRRP